MSTTKRQIVLDAFEEASIASFVFDLRPEELQSVLRRCERMIAAWHSRGITIPYSFGESPDADLDEDSGLPLGNIEAVVENLALIVCSLFGKQVPASLAASAAQSYAALLADGVKNADASRPVRANMPVGAGNRQHTRQQVFIQPDDTSPLQGRRDNGELVLGN
jgi:hypothetical protein